jgi:hypothetical protein
LVSHCSLMLMLLHWSSCRISCACSVEDAHKYDHTTGYLVGAKTYSVSDIDQLYNNAVAFALKNDIKLSVV